MKQLPLILLVCLILVLGNFCTSKKADQPAADKTRENLEENVETKTAENPAGEPDRITVQHILIAFKGSIPDESVTRTQEEAKTLAYQVLEKIKSGEDFDSPVKQYTDDSHPGIYTMSNIGVTPNAEAKEFPREKMVTAFGDVGFPLKVGEVGMADYDMEESPFGWHIIKRIK